MKPALSIVAAVGAIALSATALQAAPGPSIEDPLGDANFVNDQGTGDGSFGDFNAADAGTVSDLTAVIFTNDKKNLYVQIDTEAEPPAATGIGYRVRVNPDGPGGSYCLIFEAFHPGANNDLTVAKGQVRDACEGGAPTEVAVVGNTITVPRKAHKGLAKGATLKAPQAQSFLYTGTYPSPGFSGPMADTTKVGTDYKLRR
ncbi:MAG: hypothetical protein M3N53_00205 [Actinomycetota bacterium]|nr:hypothetical protein [Actinomycetota bacterium]